MKAPLVPYYTELLTQDETLFLSERRDAELTSVYKLLRICMILSFIIPFAGAWIAAANEGDPSVFSVFRYFLLVFWLLVVSLLIAGVQYGRTVWPLRRDLRGGEKIVEQATVERKVYMPQNGSFHLYLNSVICLSIEVEAPAYHLLRQGDEINILYAPYSKVHLGYF